VEEDAGSHTLSLSVLSVCSSTERVSVERQIKEELRDVMRTEDLENITSKQVPRRETDGDGI
jgi:hypothetical protein